ncbi:prophage replication protein [Fructilactobacillus florum 8D]|uniref:Prophage replication protein n=1 Tax=Fructilactobacillus florum 8D TaxID=1221538 RepID=W9EK03_9LACO|nr:DUF1351 domain-containing protein [Fructilactobacillus florum]ETO40009.1 prophage replication protein [Fructilactobacillus florum 8D]
MNSKELFIDETTTITYKPQPIHIRNFDTLQAKIEDIRAKYDGLVVTADSYQNDKKTKQELNKLFNRLDEQRRKVKRDYMAQIKPFEDAIKPLEDDIKETSVNIDKQLKTYDEKWKEAKRTQIQQFINDVAPNYGVSADTITIDPRFLNKSTTKKQWQDAIVEQIKLAQADELRRKQNVEVLTKYAHKAGVDPVPYVHLLSNGGTVLEIQDIIDSDIKRAEEEKQRREQDEVKVSETKSVDRSTGEVIDKVLVSYELSGTKEQIKALEAYMDNAGLIYRKRG